MTWTTLAVVGAIAAGGATVLAGHRDEVVDLSAATEVWSDVLRGLDRPGLRLTRVGAEREMRLGATLAAEYASGVPTADAWQQYVTDVGAPLAANVRRRDIRYQFHAVVSPVVNAFALPGGHIFVTTGLLEFVQSEAELASVLGHEIAHVDLRHCIERFQYDMALGPVAGTPLAGAVTLARGMMTIGYTRYQEIDADAYGADLAGGVRYDSAAAVTLLRRMAARDPASAERRSRTPVGEAAQALTDAMVDYFQTHPRPDQRTRRLGLHVAHKRPTATDRVYRGTENYKRRIARSAREFPDEWRGE